ncbi:MAG TPA: HepT-like ribonuclease domain-containing protein, partial [Anaerolineales bacterium]|nr:HepT-like ribonuclease domain-containing protein [Anaerolineales bacterium]
NQLPDDIEEKYPEIPWSLMRAMRNRLVHVYFAVDPKLLWDTIQNDLPTLVRSLEAITNLRK